MLEKNTSSLAGLLVVVVLSGHGCGDIEAKVIQMKVGLAPLKI